MRSLLLLLVFPVLLITAGCADGGGTTEPTALEDGAGPALANNDVDTDADECKFEVPLSASEEVPPTTSSASGEARIEIEDNEIEFKVEIDNPARESFVAGHIHRGPRGTNGPVVRGLFPNNPQNEKFEARGFPSGEELRVEGEGSIDPALATAICAQPEQFYVNFHTTQFPGGAIRGQLR